jgi:CBS domain-containing protein
MKVSTLMRKPAAYCCPETNLAAAAALMWDEDCGVLPVLEGGKATSVITDRDICIALGTRDRPASEVAVREVTHRPALTCGVDDQIYMALKTMREGKVFRLPVVNGGGGLEGILSLHDVILWARRGDGADRPGVSYDDVMNTLCAICRHHAHPGSQHRLVCAAA